MGNIQIHLETGCKKIEESLQARKETPTTAPTANAAVEEIANTSEKRESGTSLNQLGKANSVGDACSSTVPAPKLKVERYTAIVNNPGYVDDFDDGDRDEIRYRIVDENGQVVDDAQGYGYRSAQGAYKAMWYKFKGGRQKMNRDEQTRKQLFRSNPNFKKRYHVLCQESNFLYHKYMGIDYSIEDWHRDLKDLMEEFKIDLKYFKLFV